MCLLQHALDERVLGSLIVDSSFSEGTGRVSGRGRACWDVFSNDGVANDILFDGLSLDGRASSSFFENREEERGILLANGGSSS